MPVADDLRAKIQATATALRTLADEIERLPFDDAAEVLAWLSSHLERLRREAYRILGAPGTANPKTSAEQAAALGHLLYDALILVNALLLRNKQNLFSVFPGLQWGTPQIALDVTRVKVRLLLDFFDGPKKNQDVVAAELTQIPPDTLLPADDATLNKVRAKRRMINRGTAHLSWDRVGTPVPTDQDRREMDEAALVLLARIVRFAERGVQAGLALDAEGQARRVNLQRLNDLVRGMGLIDERTSKRPAPHRRIDLEKRSYP